MAGRIIRALRNRDLQCVALILAFFSVQYRAVVWQGRHWLHADNASQAFPWHYWVWYHARHGGLTGPSRRRRRQHNETRERLVP